LAIAVPRMRWIGSKHNENFLE